MERKVKTVKGGGGGGHLISHLSSCDKSRFDGRPTLVTIRTAQHAFQCNLTFTCSDALKTKTVDNDTHRDKQ